MAAWNLFRKSASKPTETAGGAEPAAGSDAAPPTDSEGSKDEKQGLFRRAWQKTWSFLNTDIRDLVGKEGRLVDDDFLREFYAVLVKTDMGPGPAEKIRDAVKTNYRGRKVHMEDLIETARTTVREILGDEPLPIQFAAQGPTVILVVGVNGSGKTTSIAKLANMFRKEGRSVVLGAGDTFRAAAVEQLGVWAERIGADIVKGKPNSNPASVAYQAVERAVQTNADVCIVDTAGRLQTQAHLMDELNKVYRVLSKVIPEAPHEVILVLDATAGQNAISQARGFS
ncbi:MAG: signal recognition particle-docking protein FtsY, partial [Planctomycetales bacterium]|nr:signal recognition particle-docking protein FtsY [Planctomycetales bacterium]